MIISCIYVYTQIIVLLAKGGDHMSSSGIFGRRGRDLALASATVKGITTSSA